MSLDYTDFYSHLEKTPLAPWLTTLPKQIALGLDPDSNGDLSRWLGILSAFPSVKTETVNLHSAVQVGAPGDCDAQTLQHLESLLRQLHPWRKGPYTIHGLVIDSEWRSDWKWERVVPHMAPLGDRLVLDVGCGNGYHCWRMVGAGARLVVGIDPMPLRVVQFFAIQHFLGHWPVTVLPLGIEDVPPKLQCFDTVFSMGVLYHRRSPFDHLLELKNALRSGGELILETLIIPGKTGEILVPEGRYARMRNVWFIPSPPTLAVWLKRCGFRNVRCVDITPTTTEEQRSTDWMHFESLAACLDPQDFTRTVEGYPAPQRAIFLANA